MKKKNSRTFLVFILVLPTILLTGMQRVEAEGMTMVYVDPTVVHATPGQTFSINVSIANVIDLYGYEFKLFYDTASLDGLDVKFPQGHFLTSVDPIRLFVAKLEIDNHYNTTHGRIWVAVTLLAPEPAKDGSGTLVTITFQVTSSGSCALGLCDTKLGDPDCNPIPHITDGSPVQLVPAHNVAITNIKAWPTAVPQGRPVYISVMIENQGDFAEVLDLVVYAHMVVGEVHLDIGRESLSFSIEETKLLEFVWDTTNAPYGSYWVTAKAILPEDANPQDNVAHALVGGICVPDTDRKANLFALLFPIVSAIFAVLALGISALLFIRILMSERPTLLSPILRRLR